MTNEYLAGLFDGEGCICVTKVKPNIKNREKNFRYHLVVELSNTYLPILQELKNKYGGNLRFKRKVNKPCYAWYISKDKTNIFLNDIIDFLIIKKSQAILALEFLEFKKNNKYNINRLGISEEYYNKFKELKKL